MRLLRWLVRTVLGIGLALPPLRALIRRIWGIVVNLGKPQSDGNCGRVGGPARAGALDPAYFRHPADMRRCSPAREGA